MQQKPKKEYGTCCITITQRVQVVRSFDKWSDYQNDDGTFQPEWKYKLLKSKIRKILKQDIEDCFNQDGDFDSTFEVD